MTTTTLGAVIKTQYDGRGAEQATKGLKSAGDAAKRTGADAEQGSVGVKNLFSAISAFAASSIVAAAGRAVLEFGRAINEGADLLVAEQQFENLAISIGTTADALREDMRTASGGMVTNAGLVASAVELMSGKLATSHDAVVRMSSVSGQLNWDMGVLAQTINNQSVMRLDNLGLAVDDVIPRFEELRETMGDRDAFALAVIEAGEERLELVGSTADTTAGAIDRMVVTWQDMTDGVKAGAAEAVAPTIDDLDVMTMSLGGLAQVSRDFGRDFTAGVLGPLKDVPGALLALASFLETGNVEYLERFNAEMRGVVHEMERGSKPTKDVVDNLSRMDGVLPKLADGVHVARRAVELFNDAHIENSEQLGGLFADLVDTTGAVDETGLALFRAAEAAGASAESLALLGVATGVFSDEQAEAALRAAATQQKILELGEAIAGGMSIPDALEELRLFEDALADVEGQGRTSSDTVRDLAEKIDALDGKSARMTIDVGVIGPGAGALSGGIGLGQQGDGPPRAAGGPVSPGTRYTVGERGVEEFVPATAGTIVPNGQSGETHYHLHLDGPAAPLTQEFALLEAMAA